MMRKSMIGKLTLTVAMMALAPIALARFLSPDPAPVSTHDGSNFNRYWYANNNPYRYVDPDGRYGRGAGFTDKEWRTFDRAQQRAAGQLEKAAARIDKALDTGKGMRGVTRAFEKSFGEGSATPENMRQVSSTLSDMAGALRDDGSSGFVANVDTSLGDKTLAAAVRGTGTILINTGHAAFSSSSILRDSAGHESAHSIGKIGHGMVGDDESYKYGSPAQQRAFRRLRFDNPAATMHDPDTLMEYSR